MRLIVDLSNDPAYNLALEEWYQSLPEGDFVMLWRNRPAVVVGRNQNLHRELDFGALKEEGAELMRRNSGGGAVYHDLGNVNFSFITGYRPGSLSETRRFCLPVAAFLKTLGIDARVSGRNDMTAEGKKFSGNAQSVRNGRLLHHGTLLFDSDLGVLERVLTPDPSKLASKGIRSVRARVGNLRPMLARDMTPQEFFEALCAYFGASAPILEISAEARAGAEALAETKYRSAEWIYGKDPPYSLGKERRFPYGSVRLRYECEKGVISQADFSGDFLSLRDIGQLEEALRGTRAEPEAVLAALRSLPLGEYICSACAEDICGLFF